MFKYVLILLWLPLAGFAQSTDYGRVTLLRGWQMDDGSYQAALEFTLNPGWKTYWRAPGPAGLPPVFNWEGSSNINTVQFDWPTPKVIDQDGMVTLGYTTHFVLPIRFTPEKDGPIRIALHLNFGVCSDICVPAQAVFLAKLDGQAVEGEAQIEASLASGPVSGEAAGLTQKSCGILLTAAGDLMSVDLTFNSEIQDALVVVESRDERLWLDLPRETWVLQLESEPISTSVRAHARMYYNSPDGQPFDPSDLIISIFGDDRVIEVQGC